MLYYQFNNLTIGYLFLISTSLFSGNVVNDGLIFPHFGRFKFPHIQK